MATTGSVPRKSDNPIPIAEQIESTHEAYEAGAALAHVHVRNDDETSSSSRSVATPAEARSLLAPAPA